MRNPVEASTVPLLPPAAPSEQVGVLQGRRVCRCNANVGKVMVITFVWLGVIALFSTFAAYCFTKPAVIEGACVIDSEGHRVHPIVAGVVYSVIAALVASSGVVVICRRA